MSGWGGMPWGPGPWGGFSGLTYIDMAYAVSTNSVRVVMSGNPQILSEWSEGDALNPAEWSVELDDGSMTWTVIDIEVLQEPSGTNPAIFDVFVLEVFESVFVEHLVGAVGVVDISGSVINSSAAFNGVIAEAISTPEKVASDKSLAIRDIANPPFISDEYTGGTLQITDAGDYATEEGVALVRKLVYRRLTTFQGAFFHLKNYGLALSAKSLFTSSDLTKLKAEVERQVEEEPEVGAAAASIILGSDGTLTAEIKVQILQTGQEIPMSIPLPVAAISL